MPRRVALALGVVCAGLNGACGNGSKAPMDTVELEPSPRRGVDGYGYEEERSEQTSDDVRQVGSGAYQLWLDADDRDLQARCGCTFESEGFTSPEECFDLKRRPDFDRQCSITAFEADSAELAPRYLCFARFRDALVDCVNERGCTALDSCLAARDGDRTECNAYLSAAEVGFYRRREGCSFSRHLGQATPGGNCPSPELTSSELGVRVFSGSTTGAGDDFQSVCNNDGYYSSADVALAWKAPAAQTYFFDTIGSSFETVLSVLALSFLDGCPSTELTCSAPLGGNGGDAAVAVDLAAGQTVVISVDGLSVTESGYYSVNIH